MIRIYYTDINWYTEKDYTSMAGMVEPERAGRAEKYLRKDDSRRCLSAGMLLLYSLYDLYGRVIIPEIRLNAYGKPFVENAPGFNCSISHSGSRVIVAVSEYEVGADIEQVSDQAEILSNPEALFNRKEAAYLKQKSEQSPSEKFIRFWTAKESYLKQKGVGLLKDTASFSVVDPSGDGFINGVISKRVFGDYYLSVYSEKESQAEEIRVEKEDYIKYLEVYEEYRASERELQTRKNETSAGLRGI